MRPMASTSDLRQVLAYGRVSDAITGFGLEGFEVGLGFSSSARSGSLPTEIARKRGGWFALYLSPSRHLAGLSLEGEVTLTARFDTPGRAPVVRTREVDGEDLALVAEELDVSGAMTTVTRVAGAPFVFSAAVPPRPVALRGTVVRDHDPETPAVGVAVRADGGPPAVTDSSGIFLIPELPVALTVTLTLIDRDEEITVIFRPDHSRPINTITLSRPS
jgi:hypothetical protein